ncbi:MAG: right-handed parallel beta-helix repeat-containing protein, partial [Nannocystaceae bacterium]|nr:right-handed parallel beta-helix repeat-containing protein [Nannocystaceae bacterium]
MRRLGLFSVALLWMSTGCPSVDPYACSGSRQCIRDGVVGACEPSTSRCAFPDDQCPSGLRYPPGTDSGLSGTCAEVAGTSSSTSAVSTNSSTGLGSEGSSSTTEFGTHGSSTGASSTAASCQLQPASADSWSDTPGIEVSEATITTRGVPAVRIDNSPGAVVRDLEITFEGTAGIVITDSPNVTIERIRLINAGAPKSGPASLSEVGIVLQRSSGGVIRDIFIEDARSGVVVLESDDTTLERIWVNDVRGEVNTDGIGSDEGGDCILLQSSQRVTVSGMGCTNEPDGFEPHAGVFVDRCTDVVVQDGIAENIDQQSGAGVRVHTLGKTSERITIRDFDVVGGTHACYDTLGALDVTFENTGCRNQQGVAWTESQFAGGPLRVVGGRYYNAVSYTHLTLPT